MCRRLISLVTLVLVLSLASNASADMLGHWTMDDNTDSTTVVDSTTPSYDGDFIDATGNPFTSAHHSDDRKFGTGSLTFDGVDDHVDIPSLGTPTAFTMAFWVKSDDSTGLTRLEGHTWDEGYFVVQLIDHKVDVGFHLGGEDRGKLVSSVMPDNQWYHVAVTGDVDISLVELYIDGSLVDFDDNPLIGNLAGFKLTDLQIAGDGAYCYDGAIDDFAIWNRVLSPAEIAGVYTNYPGWNYCTLLEFGDNSEDLSDYQVKVILQGTCPTFANYVDFDMVLDNGDDIRFTDSDETTGLDFWIEEWDDTTKTATIWVKVPYIPTTETKTIYVYYGKANAARASDIYATFETAEAFNSVPISGGSPYIYNSGQSIYRLHDGTLFAVWRSGANHCCDNTNNMLVWSKSTDQGRTWSAPRDLGKIQGLDNHMPSVSEFENGGVWTIITSWFTVDANFEEEDRIYVIKSTNGGETWGNPILVSNTTQAASTNHPIRQLTNGDLVMTGEWGFDVYLYKSEDGGDSWREIYVGSEQIVRETDVIETKTNGSFEGGIYLIGRNNNSGYQELWKATSTDYGETWSSFSGSGNFAYARLCEIEDYGQIGVLMYTGFELNCTVSFVPVELGSFGQPHWSWSSTAEINYASGGDNTWTMEEAAGNRNPAEKMFTPSTEKYIVEFRAKAVNTADNDDFVLIGTDGSGDSDTLFQLGFPYRDDQSKVYYVENDGGPQLRTLYNGFEEDVWYRFKILVDEGMHKISYYLYDDNRIQLATAEDKNYACGSPTALDRFQISSGTVAAPSKAEFSWFRVRKYSSPEPVSIYPICQERPAMDFDKDCKVDFTDLAIFCEGWLECNIEPRDACWE